MKNTTKLSVKDFEKHLEDFPQYRLFFGCKESGIIGNLKDLNILLNFFKENKITHIDGCVLLEFCAYIRQERQKMKWNTCLDSLTATASLASATM